MSDRIRIALTVNGVDRTVDVAPHHTLLEMLRDDLGFTGVVISDDLAAAALRDVPAGRRAVAFVGAGGDLAIVGNPAEAETMATALRDRAVRDPGFAARVDASAARVLAMKQRRGLASC